MKNIYTGVLLLFLISNINAQNNTKDASVSLRKALIGQWKGTGSLMGNTATFQMQWSTTLNKKFVHLSFSNSFTDKQGTTRTLASEAYYNFKTKKGIWVDSRGVILPLVLAVTSDTLTVLWGDTQTEQGKTTYRLVNKGIQVEDHVLRNERYFLFGKASYIRK